MPREREEAEGKEKMKVCLEPGMVVGQLECVIGMRMGDVTSGTGRAKSILANVKTRNISAHTIPGHWKKWPM